MMIPGHYKMGKLSRYLFNGVLFIKFDEGGAWRLSLAKEIKAAGIGIDMNKAL